MGRLAELLTMLETYAAPEEEAVALLDMVALARRASDPFSRHAFDPGHFTASGFVLSPDAGSLLLVHHRRLDRWLQPGGHIDPTGEGVIAASKREIAEETGVGDLFPVTEAIFDLDVHEVPAGKGEPAHLHFDVRFLFRAGSDRLVAADEVHDAAWTPLADVATMTTDRSVLRAVEKLASFEW